MENIESRVADTVLQRPEEIKIGDRTYTVAPPSVATLILVSEAVSRMPAIDIDRNRIVQGTLAGAKDCRPLGEILAIMILGAKALSGRQKPSVRISPSAGRDNGQGSLGDVPVSAAAYTAVLTGAVTADHGLAVSEVGFCWSAESRQPTVEQSQSVKLDGADAKRFSATIEGLMANTRYYLRAYAKNEKGTGYSSTVEFTSDTEQVVSLTQAMVTAFTSSTATISAQMTSTEKTKILEKGVCYGTAMNPDVNGTKVKDEGTDTKLLTATLTGLTEGQVYHARAYAVTRDGTFYSGDVQFQTETTYAPTLTTITVYDKTETGVKVRASVATNGGLDITEKGIVYSSTEAEPTLENGTKAVATGEGNDISVTLSNLSGVTAATEGFVMYLGSDGLWHYLPVTFGDRSATFTLPYSTTIILYVRVAVAQ